MCESQIGILRNLLLKEYVDFDRRLARRLRSSELASEALHETYLRLEAITAIEPVRNPKAYLFRIALNIACDRRRAENRRLTVEEVDSLLDIPDDRPDACRLVEDRSEVRLLARAISLLPERRRRVLVFSRIDGLANQEIASLLGVTVRTVETDLKQAIEHCAERLKRPARDKFGFKRSGSSYRQRPVARATSLATGAHGKALDCDEKDRSSQSAGRSAGSPAS